ncbi:Transcriptional regulatory protein ZraR [subsurface metagenome]
MKRAGYRVKAVEDGHEAIKEVEEKTYNLALVDLRMPGLDGIQVLEKIKSTRPQTRVIIYTGFGSLEDETEAISKGAADFLTKPFSPEELKLAIKKVLEQKGNTLQPS